MGREGGRKRQKTV